MEKRTIPIIALAVFSISLLSIFDFIVKPAYAQTVSNSDINFNDNNNRVFAMESRNLFVSVGGVNDLLSWVSSDSIVTSSDISSLEIEPYIGGCEPINNPCGENGSGLEVFGDITPANDGTWTGSASGLWCGLTDCFTWWDSSSLTENHPKQLHRYTISGNTFSLSGYMNVSSVDYPTIRTAITGIDTATGGIGGITVMTVRQADTNDSLLFFTGGTSLMGDVGSPLQFTSGIGVNVVSMVACHPAMGETPNCDTDGRIALIGRGTTSPTNVFRLVNMATHASVCTNTTIGTTTNSAIIEYNGNDNTFFVANNDNDIDILDNTCSTIDTNNDVITQDYISGITIDEDTGLYYVHHANQASNPIVTQFDLTTHATVNFDAIVGASISGWTSGNVAPSQNIAIDRNSKSLLLTGDTSTARIIYLTTFTEGGGGGDTTGGIDCDLPANENKLICRLDEGGSALSNSATVVIGDATDGTGLLGIGCNFDLVDCASDPNPQTNGLGILIFIGSIFVMVGMFFRSLGASETMKIPTFVWVIMIIALSAFFTITQLIDPVFLIISVIALIALASPKITGILKGGSSFGSGSTE